MDITEIIRRWQSGQSIRAIVDSRENWSIFSGKNSVYFYQIRAGNFIQTKKLLLMK